MRRSRNVRAVAAGAACLLLVAAAGLLFSGGAVAGSPPNLVVHYFFEDGKLGPLRSGITYQASDLPLATRVTPPDGKWGGTQWKANQFSPEEIQRRHLRCPAVCKPPYFGWAVIGQAGTAATSGVPRGIVLVMAGYSRTPSVAVTVDNLRTRGHGATYQPTAAVKLGGFSGIRFDGEVTAPLHRSVPFSPATTGAASAPDEIDVHGAGHGFQFTVLNVRGKTVVIFVGTEALSADQFAVFLAQASAIVASLRFPS